MGMLPKFNLARWFGNRLGTNPVRKGKRQATFLKPQLLCLEERVTPATYTVTNFGNSGTGTLRAAIDLANGTKADDTIVFDIGGSARTINLTSALPSIQAVGTAGKLRIEGPGRTALTLNGNTGNSNRDFRIFNIAASGDFTLRNVTISGAKVSSGSGAAIYNRGGTVDISSSTLTNNTAGDWGGAIRNDDGRMDVSYCTISNNTATNGGGISNHFGGSLIVNNSTISGNTAIDGGGGIFSQSSYALVSYSSVVKENSAGRDGGGICNRFGTLNIGNGPNKATISGNSANWGGGISNDGGRTNISSSTISGNYAKSGGSLDTSYLGGGIHNNTGTVTVTNSTISGNNARGGGGIWNIVGTLTVTNSTISGNSGLDGGGGSGGGIWNSGTLTVSNSTISGNSTSIGGGIFNAETLTVTNSTISGNSAVGGGGIYNNTGTLTLSNSTIASNTGGGLEVLFADTTIINCTIASNTGGRGGLYWYSFGELTLQNTILANNPAGDYIGVQPASDKSTRNLVSDNSLTVGAIMRNPLLGPLQNNGGPTFTMAPGAGSPAIGGGSASISNASPVKGLDQRSYTRITSDIGAFAYQPLATTAKLLTSTSTTSAASSLSVYDPVTDTTTDVEDPFPGFTGKIHVASGDYNGDFNGDGIGDMVVGAGQGGGPVVAIIDSQTGRVITKFFAFDPAFRGGVELACLDFNLDGVMDILVGAGPGGGPHVKIFNGKDLGLLFSFYAYANDFTGGVSLCALDVNDDGIRDLVTGAGAGGAPHVKVWDGATHTLLSQWYAYDPAFRGGVNVSGGYLGSDGSVMVVTGAGAGMAPEVAVWNALTREEISRFLAYDSQFMGGVRVRVHDGNGDGVSELVTAAGIGGAPHVKGFNFPALDLAFEFFAGNPTDTDGVAVS